MRLPKIFQMLMVATILSLVYIHMQMQIFHLAYQGKVKEKQITELREDNGRIINNILQLRSANHLGVTILSEEKRLKFRDPNSVIQLVYAEPREGQKVVPTKRAQRVNPILSFLSLKSQAEARTTERNNILKPWHRPSEW